MILGEGQTAQTGRIGKHSGFVRFAQVPHKQGVFRHRLSIMPSRMKSASQATFAFERSKSVPPLFQDASANQCCAFTWTTPLGRFSGSFWYSNFTYSEFGKLGWKPEHPGWKPKQLGS
jgi:hypothetical protein